MNRSYSKIRHIKESNMRLERRLITEGEESVNKAELAQINTELSSAGLPQLNIIQVIALIDRDKDMIDSLTNRIQQQIEVPPTEFKPEEIEREKTKFQDYVCQVLQTDGKKGVFGIIKELLRLKKEKRKNKSGMNEQTEALIFGMFNPLLFWVIFGTILLFALVIYFGYIRPNRYGPGCDRRGFIGY